MVAKILIYSTRICSYCRMAERLLATRGVQFEKILVDENSARRDEMRVRAGQTSVPQIFIGDLHVGGYVELAELESTGKLDALLE
jgi:glutaredoxin 3